MVQRKITVQSDGPKLDKEGVTKLLAFFITGGDPAAYIERLREKQQRTGMVK